MVKVYAVRYRTKAGNSWFVHEWVDSFAEALAARRELMSEWGLGGKNVRVTGVPIEPSPTGIAQALNKEIARLGPLSRYG